MERIKRQVPDHHCTLAPRRRNAQILQRIVEAHAEHAIPAILAKVLAQDVETQTQAARLQTPYASRTGREDRRDNLAEPIDRGRKTIYLGTKKRSVCRMHGEFPIAPRLPCPLPSPVLSPKPSARSPHLAGRVDFWGCPTEKKLPGDLNHSLCPSHAVRQS